MDVAFVAQFSSLNPQDVQKLYIFTGLFLLAFIGLIIFLKVFSGSKSKGDSLNLDTDFLDRLSGSGGLTADEKKRIRQAMVRQAMRDQEGKSSPAGKLSSKDLASLASQGPDALGSVVGVPESESSEKAEVKSYAQQQQEGVQKGGEEEAAAGREEFVPPVSAGDAALQDEATEKEPVEAEKKSGGAIDLDTLLERGLIEPGEYDRLKQLAEESSD